MPPARKASSPAPFYLPDFCAPGNVLAVVLVAELVAILLTLARYGISLNFWTDLARTSLFLLWVGLGSAAVLCACRQRLQSLDSRRGSALALGLLLVVTAAVTEATWWLATTSGRMLGMEAAALASSHAAFFWRNLFVGTVAGGLALRYFYVSQQWKRNVEAEAAARVRALQARIRPHFLFNSMNAIAALTRSDPARAEDAVADLADLFRVSLRELRDRIPLEEEIEIARTYERIERLRLGDRLRVNWQIDGLPGDATVPALVLQPLLENAVYHGVEPGSGEGRVLVRIQRRGARVHVRVDNPYIEEHAHRQGNRMALENIRERLQLFFDAEAAIQMHIADGRYIVEMEMPYRTAHG